jgi:hypothetical protein
MTRPKSNTVEYFPHDAHHGRTISVLTGLYGNEGYAFWFRLLEILASTENHFLKINDQSDLDYLASRTGVTPEKAVEITDKLAGLSAVDGILWLENGVIWSENLVKRIADVYIKNRGRKPPESPIPEGKPLNPFWLSLKGRDNTPGLPPVYPQSKVKESKVKESKVKEREVNPLSAQSADDDRFTQFWNQYPRHEKKKNAQEAFKRINPQNGTFEKIMESLAKFKMSEQWTRDGGKYIPHPTSWLNGRRWEDEIKDCLPDKPETAFDRSQRNIESFKKKMGIEPDQKVLEGDHGNG